jgi:predicted phosphohydrolase
MPTTIQYCSDLHLEFERNRKWIAKYPLQPAADILLMGGDIMLLSQMNAHSDFLDFVSENYKATYWIPGNHEYYRSNIALRSGAVYEAVRYNVFLVNNTTVTIGNTDLICSTLWSQISPVNEIEMTRSMSDFHAIEGGSGKLSILEYNELHAEACRYIKQAVANSKANHKIVLTHHVPTLLNYPDKYKGSVINEAFATEMLDFIESSGIEYWLYGHTHYNTPDFTIGGTQLLTNQLGYVQYGENKHFDKTKRIILH